MVTAAQVRELIGGYSPEGFAGLVKSACAPATFVEVGKVIRLTEVSDLDVRILGVVKDLPGEGAWEAPLLVADVELKKDLTERSSRVRQFKLAKAALQYVETTPPVVVKGMISQGVFVFHDKQGNFRVSLVTVSVENGKFKWSQVKRQSFYVQADPDANATFIQRMCMSWASLKDIKEVFSVEKLTKEFYNQLYKWYERACDDKRVEYPNDIKTDKDNRDDRNRKHLLRLITRLMFVWFLKQKKLVPEELFDEAKLKTILKDFNPVGKKQHQYYRAILQNLFFATLNSEIEEREFADAPCAKKKGEKPTTKHHGVKTKYRYADEFAISKKAVIDLFHPIPFLNGGLFECLDQENDEGKVMYYDGFSQQEFHRDHKTLTWAHVPNDLFFDPDYGIIPLLKRYNFTVEENTPGDADVALDPELLGKVFENLLGAYNPETEAVVRKSTGSFYTPREIVNYMVDESLIAYLDGKTADGDVRKQNSIRALVKDGERPDDEVLCSKLSAAVVSAKVLDPACGSGAFPMGALLKMTEVLRVLNHMSEDANLYKLKLQLIENCIFGSDIQEIAVQISKLRFFISLVCEQKPNWDKPNYGINTLPNLETKFVAANSLIGLKRVDTKVASSMERVQGDMFQPTAYQADLFFDNSNVQKIKDDLWSVRHKHFLAQTRKEKNELRRQDKELRTKLANLGTEFGFSEESTRLMATWDPYNQNVHADFFEPEWMFNVKNGFDIVIGNPPYFSLSTKSSVPKGSSGEFYKHNELYKSCGYSTFKNDADIYCLFYEFGFKALCAGGCLCYITSNKWMRAGYGDKLRAFLAEKTCPISLVDFSGIKIFETATVDTNVLMVMNIPKSGGTKVCALDEWEDVRIDEYVSKNALTEVFPADDIWVILGKHENSIKSKMIAKGDQLKNWDIRIDRGLLTGLNEAFIINEETRDEILLACRNKDERERTAKLIRPVLRGRDIKRDGYRWAGLYLIFTHNGDPEKAIRRIELSNYPAVKKHLDRYKSALADREDRGHTIYNLRPCAYLEDFDRPKLIYPETTQGAYFAIDNTGILLDKTCFMIVSKDIEYLQRMLSCKLFEFAYRKIFSSVGLGIRGYQYNKHALLKLPVLKVEDGKSILSAKKGEIDAFVYKLYGLTEEEIAVVEQASESGEKKTKVKGEGEGAEAEKVVEVKPVKTAAKAKRAKKPQFAEEF